MARAMHDFQEQCQTMFRAKVCLSLFSGKQCVIKTIIRFSFVMSGIIKVEGSVISRGRWPRLMMLTSTLIIPDITHTKKNRPCNHWFKSVQLVGVPYWFS